MLSSDIESGAPVFRRKASKKAETMGFGFGVGRMGGKGDDMGLSTLIMTEVRVSCNFCLYFVCQTDSKNEYDSQNLKERQPNSAIALDSYTALISISHPSASTTFSSVSS